MPPLLITIEPGAPGALRSGAPQLSLQHGVGHWAEGIERFASVWSGETLLICNHLLSNVSGIQRIRNTESILRDAERPLLTLRLPSKVIQTLDPLLAGPIGSRLVRQDWERASHPALLKMLEEEVAVNPKTTIFIPTGIAITVETVIRNVQRLKAVAGRGADLKLRILFGSQGHERRGLHPSYFGLQLKRWHDRAGNVDIRFGVEVEPMARQYSAISGLNIHWVPWPNEATNCKPGETRVDPSAPQIYIYASRKEQGSSSVYGIVRDLQKTLPNASRYTVHLDAKGSSLGTAHIREIAMTHGVAITRGELPPAQLHSHFSGAAAMILPYHAQRYRGRGSALMWAALDHSVPIIAPANTGFGEEISQHGIGFSYHTLSDIPTLVQRAIDEGDALRQAINTYNIRRTQAVELFLVR